MVEGGEPGPGVPRPNGRGSIPVSVRNLVNSNGWPLFSFLRQWQCLDARFKRHLAGTERVDASHVYVDAGNVRDLTRYGSNLTNNLRYLRHLWSNLTP